MRITRHALAPTSLGELLLVAGRETADEGERMSGSDSDALIGVYFPDHTYPPAEGTIGERVEIAVDDPATLEGTTAGTHADPLLSQAAREIREYLSGARREFEVPIATDGDATSERVWRILREIPYGETTTYGAIAQMLGSSGLAQRVGQAVGHNPLCIVIPCHRVLGADGSLTGYAGGLDRKRALLALEEPEAAETDRLF